MSSVATTFINVARRIGLRRCFFHAQSLSALTVSATYVRGEHDGRDCRKILRGLHSFSDGKAIHSGHAAVEDHQMKRSPVAMGGLQSCQARGAITGFRHEGARVGENFSEDEPICRVIINDQNSLAGEDRGRPFIGGAVLDGIEQGDGDVHGTAHARRAFRPYASAHQFGQALGNAQAQACSAIFSGG